MAQTAPTERTESLALALTAWMVRMAAIAVGSQAATAATAGLAAPVWVGLEAMAVPVAPAGPDRSGSVTVAFGWQVMAGTVGMAVTGGTASLATVERAATAGTEPRRVVAVAVALPERRTQALPVFSGLAARAVHPDPTASQEGWTAHPELRARQGPR